MSRVWNLFIRQLGRVSLFRECDNGHVNMAKGGGKGVSSMTAYHGTEKDSEAISY
ncbi:hypothetical protein BFJ69_g8288 [Fusarium oxysporum]|uniref:Uncharacterized protein n=1 Tax=Fusarium oxysporum TaxID=5507 RepID=A0A420N3E5_FUSOX|nr:hypothetical protein BFJ69_g8288 [Fusarium oxysporum]